MIVAYLIVPKGLLYIMSGVIMIVVGFFLLYHSIKRYFRLLELDKIKKK